MGVLTVQMWGGTGRAFMHKDTFHKQHSDTLHEPLQRHLSSSSHTDPLAVGSAPAVFRGLFTLGQGQCLAQGLEVHISSSDVILPSSNSLSSVLTQFS